MISRDTSKESADVVAKIYRDMSPAKKWKLIGDAMRMGQQLAMAGLRQLHPEADENQIWHLWAKQHLGDELYEEVYGDRIK
ncbi:MAG: hypothetical protein ACYTFX_04385 [Planctomycetota bacterium]|jgi:hypothetical protein